MIIAVIVAIAAVALFLALRARPMAPDLRPIPVKVEDKRPRHRP